MQTVRTNYYREEIYMKKKYEARNAEDRAFAVRDRRITSLGRREACLSSKYNLIAR